VTRRESTRPRQFHKLAREGKDVEKRIARLVAAIETGGDVPSLIAKLRELEARRHAISARRQTYVPFHDWSQR
jgi:hypothetical protein